MLRHTQDTSTANTHLFFFGIRLSTWAIFVCVHAFRLCDAARIYGDARLFSLLSRPFSLRSNYYPVTAVPLLYSLDFSTFTRRILFAIIFSILSLTCRHHRRRHHPQSLIWPVCAFCSVSTRLNSIVIEIIYLFGIQTIYYWMLVRAQKRRSENI